MVVTIGILSPQQLDEVWALVRRAVTHMNQMGNPQWGADYPTRDHYAEDIARGELVGAYGDEGTLVGVCCVNSEEAPEYAPLPWQTARPALVIHRMAVDPASQRQGVGRALFVYVEGAARGRGIPALRIDTYGQNTGMQQLILSQGYRKVGEISLHCRPLGFPCFEKDVSCANGK